MDKRSLGPNLLTIGNLFLGFWAIILIGQGQYLHASWLIVLAAIMDGLDGAVARLVKSQSTFGGQMDSLVDVISFGLAPSYLIYTVFLHEFWLVGIALAFMPLIAGVFRLARFNARLTENPRARGFLGIPITGSALILSSFYIYVTAMGGDASEARLWFSIIPAVSLFMVSPIPYRRLPVVSITKARHPQFSWAILIIAALAMLVDAAKTLFPLMMIYLLTGPAGLVAKQFTRSHDEDEDQKYPVLGRFRNHDDNERNTH